MPAWHEVRDAPARFSAERVERDGVSVLCVRLAGHAEDNPDGVGRIRDALDEFAAAQPDIEVTTLDVSEFSNASDDACSILTRVFDGLPCCWITSEWDQQHGEERWDLPPSARMAPTHAEALSRVVQWRLAGGCDYSDGTVCKWTDRGLVIAITGMEDLWHRNRLVERMIHDTSGAANVPGAGGARDRARNHRPR